ncbi:MAG: MaoC family dehydratase [Bauldia sp.]|nr:MAG: MaoC family dehydratase [Bauldia sp.]
MTVADELRGKYVDEIEIGATAIFAKTVTEADIVLYSGISGDTNPVHLNEDFAKGSLFKTRIAHGMLTAGFISAVLGTELPGPGAIYLGQTLKFQAPVKIGDTAVARVTATAVDKEKGRCPFATLVHVGDTLVIEGEAQILVPKRPA